MYIPQQKQYTLETWPSKSKETKQLHILVTRFYILCGLDQDLVIYSKNYYTGVLQSLEFVKNRVSILCFCGGIWYSVFAL